MDRSSRTHNAVAVRVASAPVHPRRVHAARRLVQLRAISLFAGIDRQALHRAAPTVILCVWHALISSLDSSALPDSTTMRV